MMGGIPPDSPGVRAAQPQVMDQLIGGHDDDRMVVDDFGPMPDRFGRGARDNFPSGFS